MVELEYIKQEANDIVEDRAVKFYALSSVVNKLISDVEGERIRLRNDFISKYNFPDKVMTMDEYAKEVLMKLESGNVPNKHEFLRDAIYQMAPVYQEHMLQYIVNTTEEVYRRLITGRKEEQDGNETQDSE